ncbi:unnamed protein product [Brachionus calyciflorus]|uniref:Uncharacterized protein n=1 Tax=Brachionus calyciflorus TaxID=104777 RepID=A0A814K130_9BILA|nr:unnamed protein product [Brachionus calyciflorus]
MGFLIPLIIGLIVYQIINGAIQFLPVDEDYEYMPELFTGQGLPGLPGLSLGGGAGGGGGGGGGGGLPGLPGLPG